MLEWLGLAWLGGEIWRGNEGARNKYDVGSLEKKAPLFLALDCAAAPPFVQA